MSKFNPAPKPSEKTQTKRQKINNRNRNFGKAVERKVADLTGGDRVIMSGAAKNSVWNLLGDVQVRKAESNEVLAVIECKGTSGITPKGDKTFTLKKSVLDQAKSEAEAMKAIAVVWIHWLNASYENDDYAIIPADSFLRLLDLAKQAGLIIDEVEEPPENE